MLGPGILVRSLCQATVEDKFGNTWRYHSRSDRHSKIACWGILFDLLRTSKLIAARARAGEVVFGINHEMSDFKVNRKKNLDLVISTPRGDSLSSTRLFRDFVDEWSIALTPGETRALSKVPALREGAVGSVQVALEAKACMTAHVKALPRLYDELNSSHLTIHGSMDAAIAVGFAMVNVADQFVSSDRNKHDLSKLPPNVTKHRQPADAVRAMRKIEEIRRRGRPGEEGFDAFSTVLVDCSNTERPVTLVERAPAPQPGDIYHYESMIRRVAQLYETRFAKD
jgi:hypothetical protein